MVLSQNPRQKTPIIPLSDGVGEITAVGEGVSRVAVADRHPVWRDDPMRGEYHLLDAALRHTRDLVGA